MKKFQENNWFYYCSIFIVFYNKKYDICINILWWKQTHFCLSQNSFFFFFQTKTKTIQFEWKINCFLFHSMMNNWNYLHHRNVFELNTLVQLSILLYFNWKRRYHSFKKRKKRNRITREENEWITWEVETVDWLSWKRTIRLSIKSSIYMRERKRESVNKMKQKKLKQKLNMQKE